MSERGIVEQFDDTIDAIFDRMRGNAVTDRLFYTATESGNFSLIWHALGAAKGLGPAGFESTMRQSLALGAESALVNGAIKSLFNRNRPVATFEHPHRLRTPATTSFPSGHASSGMMAATLLAEGSRLAPLYYATAAVVATSRIYVRIHHASDVVAGAVLGVALGKGIQAVWPLGRFADESAAVAGVGANAATLVGRAGIRAARRLFR